MEKPLEFSQFYRLLNAVKEGSESKKSDLEALLNQYRSSQNTDSPLHQLAETFIFVGMDELFNYAGTQDIVLIGKLNKEEWDKLKDERKAELPPHLANTMISYAKKENLSKEISDKWNSSKREIDKNIMNMARYITEGIIDAIE